MCISYENGEKYAVKHISNSFIYEKKVVTLHPILELLP